MVFDYIIIGGGLSGLYHAYKFHKKNPKLSIHIFQEGDRLGGRVYTQVMKNGTPVNMGAGRIATHHPNTMKLLKDLNLDSTTDLTPISNTPISLEPLEHFENETDALRFLIRIAKTIRFKIPKKYLISMTFDKVCKTFFQKKYKQIQESIFVSGYDTKFLVGSAWIVCTHIMNMFDPDLKFVSLKGGLGRITEELIKYLKSKKKIVFHLNSTVLGWRKPETKIWEILYKDTKTDNTQTQNEIKTAKSRNIHIATPLSAWEKWLARDTIRNIPVGIQDYIQYIQKIPLCRIYVSYDKPWVSVIQKCVSHSPFRFIIPINDTTIMMSYLDGEKATELSDMDESTLQEWITTGTKLTFPALSHFIPEPTEIKKGFWKSGIHIWGPMKRSVPAGWNTEDDSFSFSGEAFSQIYQGWLEGALETHTETQEIN